MERTLRSGELARRAGVTAGTLRFYERRGLLPRPARTPSGYRQYPPGALGQVRFIRRAVELGFTLAEVEDFLASAADPRGDCGDVCGAVEAKLAELDRRVREIRRRQSALRSLLRACPGSVPIRACPIVHRLREDGAENDAPGSRTKGRR